MSTPIDSDLERLREEHQLRLAEVRSRRDLEIALRNTTSKASSNFSTSHRDRLKDQLVRQSDRWFRLAKVQEVAFDNVSSDIEEKETIEALSRIKISDEIRRESELTGTKESKERTIVEEQIRKVIESEKGIYGEDWNKIRTFSIFKRLVGYQRIITREGIDLRGIFGKGNF